VPNARLLEDLSALGRLSGTGMVRTSGSGSEGPDPEEFHQLGAFLRQKPGRPGACQPVFWRTTSTLVVFPTLPAASMARYSMV
jgi:hypothetical protein